MATPPGIYCKNCSYDLRGQQTHRCPECGRPFDPANRRTFRRKPDRAWKAFLRRLAIAAPILTLLYGVMLGWLWWGWSSEQATIRQLEGTGPGLGARREWIEVRTTRTTLPLVPRLLPERWQFLLDRASEIWVSGPAAGEYLPRTRPLGSLEALIAMGPRLSDADLRPLSGHARLTDVTVYGDDLRGAGLVHLRPLPRLESLVLKCTARDAALDGRCLVHLAPLRNLRALTLANVDLGPEDLAPLAGLTKLEFLTLETAKGDGVSLAPLAALPRLRVLHLRGFPLTDKQAAELARCLGLEILDFSTAYIHLEEPGIAAFARLTSLRRVAVRGPGAAGAVLFKYLQRAFPKAQIEGFECPGTFVPPAPPAPATAPATAPAR